MIPINQMNKLADISDSIRAKREKGNRKSVNVGSPIIQNGLSVLVPYWFARLYVRKPMGTGGSFRPTAEPTGTDMLSSISFLFPT
jgi:hypothetical protein